MKKIKIKYEGFWKGFDENKFFITEILKKYYDVEICADADYIICSVFGFYDYLGNDKIRIMFSGENYIPDFNLVDYAISVYPIDFLDRHFSFPGLVLEKMDTFDELRKKERKYEKNFPKEKTILANMIASHESENMLRGDLFRLLSQYKYVEAGGTYLNNTPDGSSVKISDGSKRALQSKCKFTICPESTVHDGFVTEKIFDAFLADTIPIYCGSSTISNIVNPKSYININDFNRLEDVLKKVIELDTNDDLYLEMLNQPIFVQDNYAEEKIIGIEQFVKNIFDQPIDKAYRRSRSHRPMMYEQHLMEVKGLEKEYYDGKFNSIQWVTNVLSQKMQRMPSHIRKKFGFK